MYKEWLRGAYSLLSYVVQTHDNPRIIRVNIEGRLVVDSTWFEPLWWSVPARSGPARRRLSHNLSLIVYLRLQTMH